MHTAGPYAEIPEGGYFSMAQFLSQLHYWVSEASPTLGCSIEISRDIYMSVGMSVMSKMRRRDNVAHAHARSRARGVLAWTKKNRSLRNGKL